MQHRSPCEPALDCCEGRIEDCPRCADKVCELHAVDGLCLACQSEDVITGLDALNAGMDGLLDALRRIA
jgi:hypothetical protein